VSAYIVNKAHIDALVTLYQNGPTGVPVNPMNAWRLPLYLNDQIEDNRASEDEGVGLDDVLGRVLWVENYNSIAYHYPDATDEDRPGPVDATFTSISGYTAQRGRRLSVPEALKALRGYQYQSCEHPGWATSFAKQVVDRLVGELTTRVDGYDDADTWEIGDEVTA
jgi:hypothetical protein